MRSVEITLTRTRRSLTGDPLTRTQRLFRVIRVVKVLQKCIKRREPEENNDEEKEKKKEAPPSAVGKVSV